MDTKLQSVNLPIQPKNTDEVRFLQRHAEVVSFSPDSKGRRALDIVISLSLLILLSPLMLLIMILVKLGSRGPIFYSQTRVGMNRRQRQTPFPETEISELGKPGYNRRRVNVCGRLFPVLKFRSMRVDAEADGKPVWSHAGDPRVTFLGRLLRKTHLDELPQLINILRGEMSLVGPRPERPELVLQLRDAIDGYSHRLLVRPGVTGLAQTHHRADLSIDDVRKKIKYDRLYIKKSGVLTDLKIIFGTFPMLMGISADRWRAVRQKSPTYRFIKSLFSKN